MDLKELQIRAKYAADRMVAAVALVAVAPVIGVIAALVKLEDGGPVFFLQERLGRDGRRFMIWKIRTMVENADRLLAADGTVPATSRVTNIGRVLRKLSLDELPQLINILRGEVSFVGPRAALPDHLPRYTESQLGRLRMKPGVTGLAQVNGRNTLKWSKRIEYDLQYISEYSWWLDVKILLRTVKVVLLGEGVVLDRNSEQVDDLGPARGTVALPQAPNGHAVNPQRRSNAA